MIYNIFIDFSENVLKKKGKIEKCNEDDKNLINKISN